ncbi:MAG: acyl-CoA thioesterase [Planctomycetota bacterium]
MQHTVQFRVRYSETDPMRTYYNSRALEWFEYGRTELCRMTGKPYRQWEAEGVMLPLTEAHVEYRGRADYDELLSMTTTVSLVGRARMRFDVTIVQAETGQPVCRGYTLHAITDLGGRPIRPPAWIRELIAPDGDSR